MSVGIAYIGQGETGVVALGIVVSGPPEQGLGSQLRLGLEQGPLAEPAMPLHIPERSQGVVEPHPGSQLPAWYAIPGVEWEQERARPHQVWGDTEQDTPFSHGFLDQAERVVFEVAQTAVDEARGAAARPGSEITAFDKRGTQAAHGGVAGNAGTGDPAADDQNVYRRVGQVGQGRGAGCG